MKKQFNGDVVVRIYDRCKYEADAEVAFEMKYTICGFEVKTISVEEILKETDGSCVDDYNEYLVLDFGDGAEGTFRNSYVDMFRA